VDVKKPPLASDVGVHNYVAEVADRLYRRLADASSVIFHSLEDQIPELRGDAALVELLEDQRRGQLGHAVARVAGGAVARRGREIGSDRLDVELALLACHWYGGAVLQPK
jgi:hypothetical protein